MHYARRRFNDVPISRTIKPPHLRPPFPQKEGCASRELVDKRARSGGHLLHDARHRFLLGDHDQKVHRLDRHDEVANKRQQQLWHRGKRLVSASEFLQTERLPPIRGDVFAGDLGPLEEEEFRLTATGGARLGERNSET